MIPDQPERIEFASGGNTLVGTLYNSASNDAPGIVVTGSWLTVKEQMADRYARELAAQGFAALTFDFAMFGESEGEPRERESPSVKIEDIAAAADWLSRRGSAVGGLAICASAGYMAHAVARGAPIAAFATVAAWLHDAGTVGEMYEGAAGIAKRKAASEAALEAYRQSGEVRYVPAFSATDPDAAMGEMVAAYYGDPETGAVPEWANRFAVMAWHEWLDYDGVSAGAGLSVPTLMIHSEDAAFPDNARRFAASAKNASVEWHQGAQIEFYHKREQVDPAVTKVAAFFDRHLHGEAP